MNNRERLRAALSFADIDCPCHVEQGFWEETYTNFLKEGLPQGIQYPSFEYIGPKPDLFSYFDLIKFGYMLSSQYFAPPFEYQILEENEKYRIEISEKGIKQKILKDNPSVPEYLSYPIQDKNDYKRLRDRLISQTEKRFPDKWEELVRQMKNQTSTAVVIHIDGFFGYPRELMGLETFLLSLYQEPEFIRQLISDRCNFYCNFLERVMADIKPDLVFVWEDMCYKNGPLLSPAMFEEFMLPAYKKLTKFIKEAGVQNIIVDSDGDVSKLTPLFLKGGVTGLLPFEVKAGMDIVEIAEAYPNLQIIGGIDKHAIAKGREAIDREIDRVLPLLQKRGGYCVSLDHWVPPEIHLDDFRYYVDRVRDFKL